MKKEFIFGIMALGIVACKGGNSGGSSGSNSIKINASFSDLTVSNFQQTSGVAISPIKWTEFLISSAYAGGGDINCMSGENVSFSMDITLGGTLSNLAITTQCGSDVDLSIRRKMLASLEGHLMILEMSGQGDVGSNFQLDFRDPEGFQFDIPYKTLEEEKTSGGITRECNIDYTFNSVLGTISNNTKATTYSGRALELNTLANTAWGISNPNSPSAGNGYSGCKTSGDEYRTADFRFKNGKIELDESGTKDFSPNGCAKRNDQEVIVEYNEEGDGLGACPIDFDSTYERWCIDDNADGTCDTL